MDLKAVIFDFDGTLADTREIAYQLYVEMATKYNIKVVSKEELLEVFKLPIIERLDFFKVPLRKVPRLAREAIRSMGSHIDKAPIYPNVKKTIKELNQLGLPMYIISSNSKKNIKKFVKQHDIDYFNNIYGKASIFGKHKQIRKLLKRLNISNSNALYVGDEIRDIEACKRVGVKTIAIAWGYDDYKILEKEGPDFLVNDIDEAKRIIKDLL